MFFPYLIFWMKRMSIIVSPEKANETKRPIRKAIQTEELNARTAGRKKQISNYLILGWLLGHGTATILETITNNSPTTWRFSKLAYDVIEELGRKNNLSIVAPARHTRLDYTHPITSFPFKLGLTIDIEQLQWLRTNGWLVDDDPIV